MGASIWVLASNKSPMYLFTLYTWLACLTQLISQTALVKVILAGEIQLCRYCCYLCLWFKGTFKLLLLSQSCFNEETLN